MVQLLKFLLYKHEDNMEPQHRRKILEYGHATVISALERMRHCIVKRCEVDGGRGTSSLGVKCPQVSGEYVVHFQYESRAVVLNLWVL